MMLHGHASARCAKMVHISNAIVLSNLHQRNVAEGSA